jgi:hypothetical protein
MGVLGDARMAQWPKFKLFCSPPQFGPRQGSIFDHHLPHLQEPTLTTNLVLRSTSSNFLQNKTPLLPHSSANMADTEPTVPKTDAEPSVTKEETAKVATSSSATADDAKATTESKPETITEKAGAATSAMKDNVFSMFGGGPKKEKKEEEDDTNEPSGSSKAQAKDKDEVRVMPVQLCGAVS